MNPLTQLLLACGAFLATHFVSSTPLRAGLIRSIGEKAYLALYSAAAFATLGWMIFTYIRAPYAGLWPVLSLRYAPLFFMPFALILIVCGLLARNPTMVGQERLLEADEPARGILRVTRHPLMWGVALWAAVHMLARGDAAAAAFFGTFLVLALAGTALSDRRKARSLGERWQRFSAVTSHVPFAAIAAGRNTLKPAEIGWSKPAVGIALYVALIFLHSVIFGARPY
ncbi:MAG: NnrU family protein [Betaproteobacteria bacterium]|nr:NnrU family protein [Betaproteobacteria bacterium]MDH3435690.1 NnrU family protein [Betaproteobacteria bacterium]